MGFEDVALQIATGRKANDIMKEKDVEKVLIEWVQDYYGKGELISAMNEKFQMDFNKQ